MLDADNPDERVNPKRTRNPCAFCLEIEVHVRVGGDDGSGGVNQVQHKETSDEIVGIPESIPACLAGSQ